MKVGDVVIHKQEYILKYCLILSRGVDSFDIMNLDTANCFYNINTNNLFHLHEKDIVINQANKDLDDKINELKTKLKSVKRSDYLDAIQNKYLDFQQQIKTTAKHMIESEDIVDFENKLKSICELKKKLFTIECDELIDARKFNGFILYKVREVERGRKMIDYYLKPNYVTNKIKNLNEDVLKLL